MNDLAFNESELENHESWQSQWDRHAKWLRTILTARLSNGLLVDEVLQDVAVIAWRKREQLDDESKLAPWLYRIAIRQVQLVWRKNIKQKERFVDSESAIQTQDFGQVDPLDWLTRAESHDQIRTAFEQLGPQDKEILLLKHTEGWSYQEVSLKLGISIDKVIYRLGRARKRMRNALLKLEKNWIPE